MHHRLGLNFSYNAQEIKQFPLCFMFCVIYSLVDDTYWNLIFIVWLYLGIRSNLPGGAGFMSWIRWSQCSVCVDWIIRHHFYEADRIPKPVTNRMKNREMITMRQFSYVQWYYLMLPHMNLIPHKELPILHYWQRQYPHFQNFHWARYVFHEESER